MNLIGYRREHCQTDR